MYNCCYICYDLFSYIIWKPAGMGWTITANISDDFDFSDKASRRKILTNLRYYEKYFKALVMLLNPGKIHGQIQ